MLLTLDLIAAKDGAGPRLHSSPPELMTAASIFSDFWNDQILADEKQGLFLVLVGFILSFAFIRMSTRLMRSPRVPWWPGSVVSDGGVHVHHLVFGIVTMMIAGDARASAALGDSPYAEICAFFFGVGAGLTIDEFALWVYLDDVYWAEEGRSSIDATVIAAAGMMLILLGFSPFSFDTGSFEQTIGSILGARSSSAWSRSASPSSASCTARSASSSSRSRSTAPRGSASPARPGRAAATASGSPAKQAKAEERFPPDRHTERFKNAFRDMVGGKPSEGVAAATEEALAATREAVEEVRHRAESVARPGARKGEDLGE